VNYLAICQQTRQECDASGTGPSAVTNQTGESKRFVDWCAQAYTEIQNKRGDPGGWKWLRKGFTFNTTASLGTYAYGSITDVATSNPITRFKDWYVQSFKAYLTSTGVGAEYPLVFMEWDPFRRFYLYATQNPGQPQHFSIDPDMQVRLGPAPDAIYTVSGDYQRSAQVLAADSDIPEMPTNFHMLVVYEAMKKYAGFESAPEVFMRANTEAKPMWRDIERNQLPAMIFGDSLA
jgi:hypothetical protein